MNHPVVNDAHVRIVPKNDLRVRKLNGQLLNPAGEDVIWSGYWRRRELEGDVQREPAKPTKSAATKTKSASTDMSAPTHSAE